MTILTIYIYITDSHLVIDINKEKNTKYGYQTETSGDSERQIIILQAPWHEVSNKLKGARNKCEKKNQFTLNEFKPKHYKSDQ